MIERPAEGSVDPPQLNQPVLGGESVDAAEAALDARYSENVLQCVRPPETLTARYDENGNFGVRPSSDQHDEHRLET
ncbi:MAG: hypothetical protein ACXW61_03225 [Gemmatirosa sp.]